MVNIDRVWEEIQRLTVGDLIRLRRYACWRIKWLGRKALGRDERDLLSEAVIATVMGRRVWAEGVPLLVHLLGAVRSISSSWHARRGEEYLESELTDAGAESLFERILTAEDPETILMAKERAEQVKRLFADDEAAFQVIHRLAEGYTSKEVRIDLELTAAEYSTITKRIRRKVEKELSPPKQGCSRRQRRVVIATRNASIRFAAHKLLCQRVH